jgi:hypothetical protein
MAINRTADSAARKAENLLLYLTFRVFIFSIQRLQFAFGDKEGDWAAGYEVVRDGLSDFAPESLRWLRERFFPAPGYPHIRIQSQPSSP